jgi:hypothetical protein
MSNKVALEGSNPSRRGNRRLHSFRGILDQGCRAGPLLNILRYGDKIEDPLWAEKPSPLHGRPARRQPSGVVPWARLKDLTK